MKFAEWIKLNESEKHSLWRNTSEDFLYNLLKNGKVSSKNKKFISLSEDPDSGGQDFYGNVRIEFNENEILSQGGIFVDYEDPNFWKKHEDVAKHVTGFRNAKEYYDDRGYEGAEDANLNADLTWEQYCEDFSTEMEVVISSIKFTDNLILSVSSKKQLGKEILKELNSYKIPVNDN